MRTAAATMRGLGVRSPGGLAATNKGVVPGADEMDMTLRDATRPHMWMVSLCPISLMMTRCSCGAANSVTKNSALKKGRDVMS